MARVQVELPSLLQRLLGLGPMLEVEAETLAVAIEALLRSHPALAPHLHDERGAFREHVLCFHNETNTRWLADLDRPLADGDRIVLMQAVSGG